METYSESLNWELRKQKAAQLTHQIQDLTKRQILLNEESRRLFNEANAVLMGTSSTPAIHTAIIRTAKVLFSVFATAGIMGGMIYVTNLIF